MKKLLILIIFTFSPVLMFSQILNLDRTIEVDTTEAEVDSVEVDVDSANVEVPKPLHHIKHFASLIGASYYTFQQTSSFTNEGLNYDFTYYVKKNYIFVLSGKYFVTNSEGTDIQNLGYVHLRFRDNDTRRFSLEPYGQYQWNHTIGLIQRYLVGLNLRIKIFDNKKFDIYYGLGAMHEDEEWDYNGVTDEMLMPANPPLIRTDLFKSNQYLKASLSFNNVCDIVTAVFLQNKFDDFGNTYRLSNYTTLNIRISKKFTFSLSEDVSYDNNPVVPIKKTLSTVIGAVSIKL